LHHFQTLNRYWRLLAHYLRPQWPRMGLLALILCGAIGVQVVTPLVASRFIDQATSGGALRVLIVLALLTMGAIRAIPPVYLRSARTLHLSRWQTITTVLLPAALPEVFTGLRIGFTVTLLGVLLGEMFASKLGLGSMIMSDMSLAQSEDMVTVAIILFVFAAIANALLLLIEHRLHRRV